MGIETFNPATGEKLREYAEARPEEIELVLRKAEAAFREWRRVGFAERAAKLKAAARVLRGRQDDYAALMAREMGKPITRGVQGAPQKANSYQFNIRGYRTAEFSLVDGELLAPTVRERGIKDPALNLRAPG